MLRSLISRWLSPFFLFASVPLVALAVPAPDFNRDVRPILSENCFACHGPDPNTRDADLRLDLESAAKADLGGYAAIVPGNPDSSEIWLRITSQDDADFMPPPKAKKTLSEDQRRILRDWIAAGAPYATHWAYEPPVKADAPAVSEPGFPVRNPVDAFVLNRLHENGLRPSPKAPPHTLARRASLDLIGLPPSPEELDAFLAAWQTGPDAAWEAWLDRLFASPRFGERWALPWLDLARYADSNGYQADQLRDSWAYRDWVIAALNANMPYDRFTIEQLAGDLLPNATVDQKIATGFHRTVTCNVEAGVHPEENRFNQVVDRVNTTGTVWLGSTLECAQCHDHKYDPFSMRDYYSIFAYFNQTPVEVENPSGKGVSFDFYGPKMALPMTPEKEAVRRDLQARIATLEAEEASLLAVLSTKRPGWEANLTASLERESSWRILQPSSLQGSGGESSQLLPDSSLLVTGPVPDKTSYTVQVRGDGPAIRALRIEMLPHDSLPENGPARGNTNRPNAIINEIRVFDGENRPVALSLASSGYAQNGFGPELAIDGSNATRSGWAISPQFGQPHWIAVALDRPVDASRGFRIELDHTYGGGRIPGRLRFASMTSGYGLAALPEDIAEILRKDSSSRSAAESKKLDTHHEAQNPGLVSVRRDLAAMRRDLAKVAPDTTLVMVELEEKRDTFMVSRGNYLDPTEKVSPATPSFLHGLDPSLPGDRLGLARWLVAPENPLVARVAVNRWWNEIFGHGIVATLEDFGTQSVPPTHPQLLDWLAVEFMESGWNMQHILRVILTSSTYQQDSTVRPDLREADPANHFYARGPRFRLSAELIRDTALASSGLLTHREGGRPIMPYQPPGLWRQVGRNEPKWIAAENEERFGRGIYVVYRRAAPYPSFVNFDASDRAACLVKRGRTNTPLQALTLLNDPAYAEAALALADRVLAESPSTSFEARLDLAFRLVLQRAPRPDERATLEAFLEERQTSLDPDAASALIDPLSKVVPLSATAPPVERAAWFYLGNVLLNLDEAITKS